MAGGEIVAAPHRSSYNYHPATNFDGVFCMLQSALPNGRLRSALSRVFRVVGAVALVATSFATIASSPASAATRIEKTFGKWAVVCIEPDKEAKNCSMIQSHMQANEQTKKRRLVLRWTISTNKGEQTQALIVPAGVSLSEGVRLFLGDAEPIVVAYSVCGPRVCIASAAVDAKTIAAIKASKKASASYVRGSKQLVQVELNLNGFGEAYDFIVQQLS
jgi:invasion protein IalB